MKTSMTEMLSIIFCLIICLCLIPSVSADGNVVASGTCGNNLTWVLDSTGKMTISGTGDMDEFSTSSPAPWDIYSSNIKTVLVETGVTSIGSCAFYGYNELTTVIIEDGLTDINGFSFSYCKNIKKLVVPSSVESISSVAFSECSGLESAGPSGSGCDYEFGWTDTILAYAFSNCTGLTSVIIPTTVMTIDDFAFNGCYNLSRVTIPEGVTSIGDYAFYGCSLAELYIPDSIINIGRCAFWSCSKLARVNLPNGESIGENAFGNCEGLEKVIIPAGLTNIGHTPFYQCHSLTDAGPIGSGCDIEFGWENQIPDYVFDRCGIKSITIPYGISNIGENAFCGCSLTNVELPESVISLGKNAFSGCSQLKSVTISHGLTSIGYGAFYQCEELTSVTIPDSVINIDAYAFRYCRSLKMIVLPGSVTNIGISAFDGCSSLTLLVLEGNMPTIASNAFSQVTATALYSETAEGYILDKLINYGGNLTWKYMSEYSYSVSYFTKEGTTAPETQTCNYGDSLILDNNIPVCSAEIENYTIRLNANGGTVSPSLFSATRITNYIFTEWNTEQDGSGTSYAPGQIYTANLSMTLYAQWNNETEESAVTLPTPIRDNYIFKGWATTTDAAEGAIGEYMPEDNITLYAIWELKKYTISYDANGGTDAPSDQLKTIGENLILSSIRPIHEETTNYFKVKLNANGGSVSPSLLYASSITTYDFINWNTEVDRSGISYDPGDVYTEDSDLTLYAQWNSETETATVSLPSPTYGEYTFLGWATSIDASESINGYYTPDGNITLYALWDKPNVDPDFILPSSTTVVGEEAFAGCAFHYVILSEHTTEIQKFAFSDCRNLEKIYIPESTVNIDNEAFSGDDGLIIIGKSGSYAEAYAQLHGFDFSPQQ